ncbi:peptidase U32 family protein [Syntrophomonas erecta]
MLIPELVLPAGNIEKLKTALLFGADAVYAGGEDYSLRAFAGNLTLEEIREGLRFAHQLGKKLYITVNILAHNHDLANLPVYLEALQEIGVDGVIIADFGIMRMIKRYAPDLPITVSTQANVTNYETAAFLAELGARRVVVARELSLKEIVQIKKKTGLQIEVFIHGAMCVSYSGRCLLSYYMTGRSANQGECAHPCRYHYFLMEEKRPGQYWPIEEDHRGTYIMNSRDLCLLEHIPDLIEAGIDAFKVEGRMKSLLYVASVARVYRQAIDVYQPGKIYDSKQLKLWMDELEGTATRPFTNGFITGEPGYLQDIEKTWRRQRLEFCGIARGYHSNKHCIEVEQRANFGPGDYLQWLLPGGKIQDFSLQNIYDLEGKRMDRARHARQRVLIPSAQPVPEYSILRRVGESYAGQRSSED